MHTAHLRGLVAVAILMACASPSSADAQTLIPSTLSLELQKDPSPPPLLRYRRLTIAGATLFGAGVAIVAIGTAISYATYTEPYCEPGDFCLDFGPGLGAAASALIGAPFLVSGAILLGIGVGRRRRLQRERPPVSFAFGLTGGQLEAVF